jgi:hypothetical protein
MRAGGKELGEELVDEGEVGQVGNDGGGVDDEGEAGAARAENGVEVEEGLAHLLFGVGRGLAGGDFEAGLTGDEE